MSKQFKDDWFEVAVFNDSLQGVVAPFSIVISLAKKLDIDWEIETPKSLFRLIMMEIHPDGAEGSSLFEARSALVRNLEFVHRPNKKTSCWTKSLSEGEGEIIAPKKVSRGRDIARPNKKTKVVREDIAPRNVTDVFNIIRANDLDNREAIQYLSGKFNCQSVGSNQTKLYATAIASQLSASPKEVALADRLLDKEKVQEHKYLFDTLSRLRK